MDSSRRRWLDGWREAIFGAGPERKAFPETKPIKRDHDRDPLVAARIRANATDMEVCTTLTVDDYGVITAYNSSMQSRYETNAHFVDSPELAGHGPVEV